MNPQTLRAEVSNADQLKQALSCKDFRYIYVPERLLCESTPDKERIIAVPPVFLADREEYTRNRLKELSELGFKAALAHTCDHIPLIQSAEMSVHGGVRLNIANSEAAGFFSSCNFEDITLSCELTVKRINALKCNIPKGMIAYGRLPLMVMRRCPVKDGKPCGSGNQCGKSLVDRRGRTIELLCYDTVELLNPDTLNIADKTKDFPSVDFFILKFTVEKNIAKITEAFKNGEKYGSCLTNGLYYRGVQ